MSQKFEDQKILLLERLPKPPDGAMFEIADVREHYNPHPFCITDKHVEFASKYHNGILDMWAITSSNAPCGFKGCRLSIDEHRSFAVVYVRLREWDGGNLKIADIPGLDKWLGEAAPVVEEVAGKESGFAFLRRNQ